MWDPDNINFEQDKKDWRTLAKDGQVFMTAFLAAFYDGEENVTRTLKAYLEAPQDLEDSLFDPVQEGLPRIRIDEGRHIVNGQWLMMKLADSDKSVVTVLE